MKSAAIQSACDLTGKGFKRVCKFVKPGVNENGEVEAEFAHRNSSGTQRPVRLSPIIASGANNKHSFTTTKTISRAKRVICCCSMSPPAWAIT